MEEEEVAMISVYAEKDMRGQIIVTFQDLPMMFKVDLLVLEWLPKIFRSFAQGVGLKGTILDGLSAVVNLGEQTVTFGWYLGLERKRFQPFWKVPIGEALRCPFRKFKAEVFKRGRRALSTS